MNSLLDSKSDSPSTRAIHSVSAISKRIRDLLEGQLPALWIQGTLSNLVKSAAGHWYFSIKDEKAQLRCVMFKGRNRMVRENLKDGDEILLCGKVGIYEGRGDLQLIVDHIESSGIGLLQKQFEKLKQDLLSEGLLDSSRKQPLPAYPNRIGVITSPTGAVIHDIVTVLERRAPQLAIDLYPTLVQGNEAADAIVEAIAFANRSPAPDLVILARGGGSLEDLWPFNEERVARAIAASSLPIVSAVGHETDFTIADMIADLRAPTPSAAAEIVSKNYVELSNQLSVLDGRAKRAIKRSLESALAQVTLLRHRLKTPEQIMQQQTQRLDSLRWRLNAAQMSSQQQLRSRLQQLKQNLLHRNPQVSLTNYSATLASLKSQLKRAMTKALNHNQQLVNQKKALLEAFGPTATLQRGYAVVQNQAGQIVRDDGEVVQNEKLDVRLASGSIAVRVDE